MKMKEEWPSELANLLGKLQLKVRYIEIKNIAQNHQNLPSQTDQTTNFATKIKNTNTK